MRTDLLRRRDRWIGMATRGIAQALGVCGILLLAACDVHAMAPEDRLNVILISLDTVRPDHLSCYGYHRQTTPHIDEIAKDGVLFTQAFSQAPNTFPSHLSIFTSRYPRREWVAWKGGELDPSTATLTEILKQEGYHTAGFTHFTSSTLRPLFNARPFQAFDVQVAGTRLKLLPDGLFEWLQAHHDQPFFLFLHELDAHEPHVVPIEYDAKRFNPIYRGSIPSTWTELDAWFASVLSDGDVRQIARKTAELEVQERELYQTLFSDRTAPEDREHLLALYDAQLHYLDEGLGKLFQALKNLDLMERTLIVMFSDHGQAFGEHGMYVKHAEVYDEVIHIVLLVRDPRLTQRDLRVHQIVQGLDVMPTILELLGLDIPESVEGTSLVPLIQTGRDAAREEVTVAVGSGMRSIRTPTWKLISRVGVPAELYHLETDPKEQRNSLTRHADLAVQLQHRLDAIVSAEVAGPAVDMDQWLQEHGYW